MNEPTTFAAALLIGLMSSTTASACAVVSAPRSAPPAAGRARLLALAYNLGRIGCYALLGLIASAVVLGLGALLAESLPNIGKWFRSIAALLVIALGLYVAGWWLGLTRLERLGSGLWRRIQPF